MAMPHPTTCGTCRHSFDPPLGTTGGIVNCPKCGKAVEVGGLDDPLWWTIRWVLIPLAIVVAGVIGAFVGKGPGAITGVLVAAAIAAICVSVF